MKQYVLKLTLPIIILLITGPAQAESLWGRTKQGMSPEEVMKVTKNAHQVENGDPIVRGGFKELLRIDNFEVVNESFRVGFYFKDRKLDNVTLTLNDQKPFSSILPIYKRLAEVLQSKYGKELSDKGDPDAPIAKFAARSWMSGRTEISLFALGVRDTPASLTITYTINLSKEADKL